MTENHEPIISRDDFEKVQRIISEKEMKNPHVKAYEYRFKDMVFCSECGCKFSRKKVQSNTPSEHYVWKCRTYNHKGKEYCSNKQIPDEVLIKMADSFQKEIIKIIIHLDNKVQFVFSDCSEEIRKWEIDRHWNDEMKARNYYNQRRRYL